MAVHSPPAVTPDDTTPPPQTPHGITSGSPVQRSASSPAPSTGPPAPTLGPANIPAKPATLDDSTTVHAAVETAPATIPDAIGRRPDGWLGGPRWTGVARAVLQPAVMQALGATALAGLAIAGVARVPVFADEADNVLGACLMARGALIYRDFFSHHFPLPYYALSALGESGACSVLAGRMLGGVLLVLAGLAFAWVTRSRLAPLALFVVTLAAPAYYLQLYLAETFVAAGLILDLALLTERGRRLHGLPAHALRFAAFLLLTWSSPIGAMMAVVLAPLVVLAATGRRWPIVAACGAALATFPALLAIRGTLGLFVEQAVLFNVQVYSKYLDVALGSPPALLWETLSFARHRFSFVVDGAAGQEMKATVATFTAYLELALLLLAATLVITARGDRLFRVGACLLLPLAVARDGFHLGPFIPLACFACAYLLPGVTARGSLAGVTARGGVLGLGGLLVMVLALRVYFFHLPLRWDAADELARSLEPDHKISSLAGPDDAVLFLPIAPQGYLAQERRPGSFYTFFLPWQAEVEGAEDRVIADIEANRVAVVYMDQDTQVWGKYRLREYAPRLHAYVLATFRPVDHRDPRRARIFARAGQSP